MSVPDPGEARAPQDPEPRTGRAGNGPLRLPPPYFRIWAPLVLCSCLTVLAYITGRLLKYW